MRVLLIALVVGTAAICGPDECEGNEQELQSDVDALLQTYQKVTLHTGVKKTVTSGSNKVIRPCVDPHHFGVLTSFVGPSAKHLLQPITCHDENNLALSQYLTTLADRLSSRIGSSGSPSPKSLLFAYMTFSALAIFMMFRSSITMQAPKEYPERDAWECGILTWLWMGWASPWIYRWSQASHNGVRKIEASEVPMPDPSDECTEQHRKFNDFFNAECVQVGLENISLVNVLLKWVTYRKIALIALWNGLYEGFMFLGPPVAIAWMTNHLSSVFIRRQNGEVIPEKELAMPTLMLILLFTGLPMLMAISNSVSHLLIARIGIRISGSLSSAVYAKASRLPMSSHHGDRNTDDHGMFAYKGMSMDGDLDVVAPSTSAPHNLDTRDALASSDGLMSGAPVFNLVQLVASDINTNIVAIPLALARIIALGPLLLIMLGMLLRRTGWAFALTMAVFVVNVALVTCIGLLLRTHVLKFLNLAGSRLQLLQQAMKAIHFIKSLGAEEIVRDRFEKCREAELQALNSYWSVMNFMYATNLCFPKIYVLVGLGGTFAMYSDRMHPTDIIAMLPLLLSVQSSISVVFSLIPALVFALPSCRRLESFLKMREAPYMLLDEKASNTWVTYTDEDGTVLVDEAKSPDGVLRLKGSFSWHKDDYPSLHNIDLSISEGKAVAILGGVGSGKTALLHAILGELHLRKGSELMVPSKIAYSPQHAHIFEGTLRDNITYGESFDSTRYLEAIKAAGLQNDIDTLPGKDEVQVGSQGIMLSVGQKARVSIARAVYTNSSVLLIDNPFGSVDLRTGQHAHEQQVHSALMKTRSRVIVCQPDSDCLHEFDWVVVMSKGHIAIQGTPEQVMTSKEFKQLRCKLDSKGSICIDSVPQHENQSDSQTLSNPCGEKLLKLQGAECEDRATCSTFMYFTTTGGWSAILCCVLFYLMKIVFDMAGNICLATWMNHGVLFEANLVDVKALPKAYIIKFLVYQGLATLAWFICWISGQTWTMNMSKRCHHGIINALLRAPLDRFFDKTPLGRIMNRMTNDMMCLDLHVFVGICSMVGMMWNVFTPIAYVHCVMPCWFGLISVPFYYLVFRLIRRYWAAMVPLRYLTQVSRSLVSHNIAEVEASNAIVRAHRLHGYRLRQFQQALRSQVSSAFMGETLLLRWVCNRLLILGGFFVTCLALILLWVPGPVDTGHGSLCIMLIFNIIVMVEPNISISMSAQHQLISMNRIFEYTNLPQEAEEEKQTDATFRNFVICVKRSMLGKLESRGSADSIQILRHTSMGSEVLLQQIPSRAAFLASIGKKLADLAPCNEEMRRMESWHRIIAVNSFHLNASEMAEELCNGVSEEVILHVHSAWLADGVKVEIKNLRAGYADAPHDVLRGVNIAIPRRCKLGVVGSANCGKSTLLQCILRVLEPRSGRIFLEGVDTQNLGLCSLRRVLGLVPQDPIMLFGSLRFNLDPFSEFDDDRIWEALTHINLMEHVNSLEGGLNHDISINGRHFSFGQRQLLSLARCMIGQPKLILLDEAASGSDPQTQSLVRTSIKKSFPNSTMIVIAHQLETLQVLDMVAVLDQGRIVEKGAVKELSQYKGGLFAKMVAANDISVDS